MDLTKFVAEDMLVLVAVIYVIGLILKGLNFKFTKDNYIPAILLVIAILLSIFKRGFTFDAITQGVIVTGVAVYVNQLYKQTIKPSDEDTQNKK